MQATSTTSTTATTAPSPVVAFESFAIAKGKGVTQYEKIDQAVKNGAHMGALLAVGKHRKAIIEAIATNGVEKTVHDLASGNIRPAYAAVVEVSGKAESMLTEDGKAPYSEWLRLGATLRDRAQRTSSGKPTTAAKALELWEDYTQQAAAIRATREAQRKAIQ